MPQCKPRQPNQSLMETIIDHRSQLQN